MGRFNARGDSPTRAAMTVMVSPGHARTATESLSASSAISVEGRRPCTGGLRGARAPAVASENACWTATITAFCCATMCSRTSRSTFPCNVSGLVLMNQICRTAPARYHPLNGYLKCLGAMGC